MRITIEHLNRDHMPERWVVRVEKPGDWGVQEIASARDLDRCKLSAGLPAVRAAVERAIRAFRSHVPDHRSDQAIVLLEGLAGKRGAE